MKAVRITLTHTYWDYPLGEWVAWCVTLEDGSIVHGKVDVYDEDDEGGAYREAKSFACAHANIALFGDSRWNEDGTVWMRGSE